MHCSKRHFSSSKRLFSMPPSTGMWPLYGDSTWLDVILHTHPILVYFSVGRTNIRQLIPFCLDKYRDKICFEVWQRSIARMFLPSTVVFQLNYFETFSIEASLFINECFDSIYPNTKLDQLLLLLSNNLVSFVLPENKPALNFLKNIFVEHDVSGEEGDSPSKISWTVPTSSLSCRA